MNDYYQSIFKKYLDGEATQEEIALLAEWFEKRDAHWKEWTDGVWNESSARMDENRQKEIFRRIEERIGFFDKPESAVRPFFPLMWKAAAVILMCIATGVSTFYYAKSRFVQPDAVVCVEKGQKSSVILPDGSKVWINADSRLTYGRRFDADERSVYLDGEAYFEVSPDADRPFIVHTKHLSVRALGTSFNVKSYRNEEVESAVLVSGKVEVSSSGSSVPVILQPNEKAVYDKQTSRLVQEQVPDVALYQGWMHNNLIFNAESLDNIAKELERYYNVRIVLLSERLKTYRFTGNVGNTSLDSMLQILSFTAPLTYKLEGGVVWLQEDANKLSLYNNE